MKKVKKKEKCFFKKIIRVLLYIVVFIFLYGIVVLWPIKTVIPKLLTGNQLILFTNENEARPCGGFLTAFGTVSLFPFEFELKNVYHFEKPSFGKTEFPLSKVAPTMKFWDLGTTSNLSMCAKKFQMAYEEVTDLDVKNVILVDFETIEAVATLLGTFDIEGESVQGRALFSLLSRKAANIDRHDETALDNRKKVAANVGKTLIKKGLRNPLVLLEITRLIRDRLEKGALFMEDISPNIEKQANDFSVTEWNLGGGKSSRVLKKNFKISAREESLGEWEIVVDFLVEHQGGENEPISQFWKGGFEIQFPSFLGGQNFFVEHSLKPGEKFQKTFREKYIGDLSEVSFSIFRPRGQKLFLDVSIALFPEKVFEKATFETRDGLGHFFSELEEVRKIFAWTEKLDQNAPFVTLHEVIKKEGLTKDLKNIFNESSFLAEIHFNEKVVLKPSFSAILFDRDFENTKITEHPQLKTYKLLSDNKTLIIGFSQEVKQLNERFYLQLFGIEDLFGNQYLTQKRTLIPR
ncbi:DUF4012 domain-containing protein [Candidatus Gracilibacteria bacterium]|nr:DUF4012 domain-containing protein [Candidatus Gracilibacteria bacterium]